MIGLSALLVGVLSYAAVYLILSRNVQRVVIGFILLSNAVNLLVLTASGISAGAEPPLLHDHLRGAMVDPLPQAFVLTAIVIGMGTAAFLLALAVRTCQQTGSDELSDGGR